MTITTKPFYRVVHVYYLTYHMVRDRAVYHLVLCLSCGHWREIKTKTVLIKLVGRLFSCSKCGGE